MRPRTEKSENGKNVELDSRGELIKANNNSEYDITNNQTQTQTQTQTQQHKQKTTKDERRKRPQTYIVNIIDQIHMASAIATRRLRKELLNLQKDPPPGVIAEPQEHNILTWFFALRGPSNTPYHGGVYIGKLVFPAAYPMKAPRILMLTPSARFVVNERICMSMSDFHPELWNPTWSVATILTGVVSFMTSEEVTTGGITASEDERKRLAKESIDYNKKNYSNLFQGDLMAALDRADEAREVAEKERIATLVKKTKSKATAVQSSQQEQIKQNVNEQDGQQQQQQQQHDEQSKKEELTPEEAEKRRLKNAKKRAKQKAKKQQSVAGADNDDDDANEEEESSAASNGGR